MSNGLLVFIEHKGGTANRSSFEAIAAAQSLGSQLGQKVTAVVLGADVAALAQEIEGYDLEKVICATNPKLAEYTPDAYADGMEHIVKQVDPNFVFLTHTYQVRDFAPKLAARGYRVDPGLGAGSAAEARRFLDKCIARIEPMYMAVSLPDSFQYPADDARDRTPGRFLHRRPQGRSIFGPSVRGVRWGAYRGGSLSGGG